MRVEEKVLNSPSGRPFSIDMRSNESSSDQSIIIFVHGFKGFKDAMHFNAIANTMANADFTFIKMNFSHNGTTPNHPTDFVDLEAFSENNFTKELQDIDATINTTFSLTTSLSKPTNQTSTSSVIVAVVGSHLSKQQMTTGSKKQ